MGLLNACFCFYRLISFPFSHFQLEIPVELRKLNHNKVDEIASIKDIDEEDDCGSDVEDVDLAELPDPSEHEDTINWYDPPDADELTEHEKHFYNGTQDIDIEKS